MGAGSPRSRPHDPRVHVGDEILAARGDAEAGSGVANARPDRRDVRCVVDLQDPHAGPLEERLRAGPATVRPDHQVGPQGQDVLGPGPDHRHPGRRRPQVGERLAGIRRQGQDAAAPGEPQHVLVGAVVQAHDPPGRSVRCVGWRGRTAGGGEHRYRAGHESRHARRHEPRAGLPAAPRVAKRLSVLHPSPFPPRAHPVSLCELVTVPDRVQEPPEAGAACRDRVRIQPARDLFGHQSGVNALSEQMS